MSISDIYKKLSDIDAKLVKEWAKLAASRLQSLAGVMPSPFVDPPKKSKDPRKASLSIRATRRDDISIFGRSPNAGRVEGHGVAFGMHRTKPYRAYVNGSFHVYGMAQDIYKSVGVPTLPAYYGGSHVDPVGYFGRDGYVYARTADGRAVPIYSDQNYADWLMEEHLGETQRIIIDTGMEIAGDFAGGGGFQG